MAGNPCTVKTNRWRGSMDEEWLTNWLALWAPGKQWLGYLQNFPPFHVIFKKAWQFFAGSKKKHSRIFICFVGYGNFTSLFNDYFNDNFPFRPVIQQHWEIRKNVLGVKLVGIHSCYVVVVHLRVFHSLAHIIFFFQTSLSSHVAKKTQSQDAIRYSTLPRMHHK